MVHTIDESCRYAGRFFIAPLQYHKVNEQALLVQRMVVICGTINALIDYNTQIYVKTGATAGNNDVFILGQMLF
jgi:hypothetical protein